LKNFGKPGLEDGVVQWRNVLCPEKVEVRGRRNGIEIGVGEENGSLPLDLELRL
jgi:hypothetical protein